MKSSRAGGFKIGNKLPHSKKESPFTQGNRGQDSVLKFLPGEQNVTFRAWMTFHSSKTSVASSGSDWIDGPADEAATRSRATERTITPCATRPPDHRVLVGSPTGPTVPVFTTKSSTGSKQSDPRSFQFTITSGLTVNACRTARTCRPQVHLKHLAGRYGDYTSRVSTASTAAAEVGKRSAITAATSPTGTPYFDEKMCDVIGDREGPA